MDKRLEDFHSLREATSHRKLHRCAVVAIRLFDRRCSELKELNRSICSIQAIFRLTRPVKWCLFQAIFVIRVYSTFKEEAEDLDVLEHCNNVRVIAVFGMNICACDD